MAAKFVSRLTLTAEDIADSEQLEPAFESLLRSLKVHDSVIAAMRANEVTDRALFTDLAQDESQQVESRPSTSIRDAPRRKTNVADPTKVHKCGASEPRGAQGSVHSVAEHVALGAAPTTVDVHLQGQAVLGS